jgi:hypothetical protein
LFTHSFETYSGANSRIVFPKFRRVIIRDSFAIASICVGPFGSSNAVNRSNSGDLRTGRPSSVGMKEVGMNTWTYAAKRLPQRAIRLKQITPRRGCPKFDPFSAARGFRC